jgi:hypothetical protein
MDKLEEHIRKNREALDRYNPPSGVWRRIRKKIFKKKSAPLRLAMSIAAMFTIILASALLFLKPGKFLSVNRMTGNNSVSGQNPQLKETEIYYNNLVYSLYNEVSPFLTANPDIRKELLTDISHLDSIYMEIRRDLNDNIANQEVIDALIQNYRIKIELLEDMLKILREEENNPDKNPDYEL